MINPTQGDIDRALCGFDPRDEIHIRSGVTAMGPFFIPGYIVEKATATAAKHRDALEKIAAAGPQIEPEAEDWGGNTEEAESYGYDRGLYDTGEIARAALKDEE
jgi:hypothetical protein